LAIATMVAWRAWADLCPKRALRSTPLGRL
jgi:hypothetical protein